MNQSGAAQQWREFLATPVGVDDLLALIEEILPWWWLETGSGGLVDVSDAAEAALGYGEGAFADRVFTALIHPDDLEVVASLYDGALAPALDRQVRVLTAERRYQEFAGHVLQFPAQTPDPLAEPAIDDGGDRPYLYAGEMVDGPTANPDVTALGARAQRAALELAALRARAEARAEAAASPARRDDLLALVADLDAVADTRPCPIGRRTLGSVVEAWATGLPDGVVARVERNDRLTQRLDVRVETAALGRLATVMVESLAAPTPAVDATVHVPVADGRDLVLEVSAPVGSDEARPEDHRAQLAWLGAQRRVERFGGQLRRHDGDGRRVVIATIATWPATPPEAVVVEPDRVLATLVGQALAGDFTVTSTTTVDEAISAPRDGGRPPALVVLSAPTDLTGPDDPTDRVRAAFPEAELLVAARRTDLAVADETMAAESTSYSIIAKPFSVGELLDAPAVVAARRAIADGD